MPALVPFRWAHPARLLVFLLLVLLGPLAARAQTPAWQRVVQLGDQGSTGIIQAWNSVADANGNVYVVGDFSNTARFGSITVVSSSQRSSYIAKWSSTTNTFAWVQVIGGFLGADAQLGLSGNSLYYASMFTGPLSLNGAPLPTTSTAGILVAKFTDAGSSASLSWTLTPAMSGNQYIKGLAVSGSELYLTGTFTGTAQLGTTLLTSAGQEDIYVAKLTDAGSSASVTWAQRLGGPGRDAASSLAVDGPAVYVAAGYDSPQLSVGSTTLTNPAADSPGFIAKLVDSGASSATAWAFELRGTGLSAAYNMVAQNGNLYAAGATVDGPTSFYSSGYVAKLRDVGPTLSLQWLVPATGPYAETVVDLEVAGSRVFVVGQFRSASVSIGGIILTNPYQLQGNTSYPNSLFVARLTDAGSSATVDYALAGTGGPGVVNGYSISRSGTQLFVVGTILGSVTFDGDVFNPGGMVGFLTSFDDAAAPLATTAPWAAGVALYPNPAHDQATVRLPALPEPATLQLTNALGRPVLTQLVKATAGPVELPLRGLAPGLYHLRVQAGGRSAHRTLLVQ